MLARNPFDQMQSTDFLCIYTSVIYSPKSGDSPTPVLLANIRDFVAGSLRQRSCHFAPDLNLSTPLHQMSLAAAASSVTRVVVTRRLPPAVLAALTSRPSTVVMMHDSDEPIPNAQLQDWVSREGGAHALLCLLSDKVDKSLIDSAGGSLKVVSTMSVGYSHIDVPACRAAGVRIGYTPGVLTNATADLVLALTLAACRRIVEAAAAVKSGEWSSWKPFWMTGKDLAGARVGIIGMGRIGEAVAQRLRGFGCDIIYTGRSGAKPETDAALGTTFVDKATLYSTSDVIIVICALTPDTKGMIDAAAFASMKEDVVFINASRGEVVVQDDLIAALQARPQMRAGLDVTTPEPLPVASPLLSLPNCTVLPHIGSASEACRLTMAQLTVDNAIAALEGKPMPAEVKE